jgi:hypothetical protein
MVGYPDDLINNMLYLAFARKGLMKMWKKKLKDMNQYCNFFLFCSHVFIRNGQKGKMAAFLNQFSHFLRFSVIFV